MDELRSFLDRFCRAGAAAVQTYIKISNMPADTMPEYFLSSLIFPDIGVTQAVTLETPWWQIHEWIREEFSEQGIGREGSWKVDMVIYDGGGKQPEDQKIWAMVEVKNGYIDADFIEFRRTDRDKLIRLSRKFKEANRPHLICCGAIHDIERRDYHKGKAATNSDLWFEAPVDNLPRDFGPQRSRERTHLRSRKLTRRMRGCW